MKILLSLFTLISSSLIWSQEKSEYKGWSFGINISPEIGYRFLATDSSDYMTNYIVDQRNEREIPTFLFSTGLSTEYRFSKLFSIRSGLHYSLRGEKSKDIGLGANFVYPNNGLYVEKYIYRTQYHYVGVPIIGSFHFLNNEKFQLFTSVGVSLDFLYLYSSRNTTKIHNEQEKTNFDKGKISENDMYDYNIFNPTGLLSIGFDWRIGNKSTLRIEPNFKISILPMVNAPIEGNYYNYGLNIGYLYTLK